MTVRSIEAWKVLQSTYSYSDQWVRLRSDVVLLPNGTRLAPYHTLEIPDGVNILAFTPARKVILVEQYRHPVGRIHFELPAGHINANELAEEAARRELVEETGFSAGTWHYLGETCTMASRLSNRIHNFLAIDVVKTHDPSPDAAEIIRVHCLEWAGLMSSIVSGQLMISEANQLATFFLAQQFAQAKAEVELDI